jgi:hypothetical protein
MSIQKAKAESIGILFEADFNDIGKEGGPSPFIKTD